MANRLDWNALEDKIKSTLATNEALDNRTKALTVVAISSLLDIDIEDAIDAITDAGNDRGVDAIYIDDREGRNDIHLFQTKCVSTFDKSKNNFPGAEVDKIITFVTDLLNDDKDALKSANQNLKMKIADALTVVRDVDCTASIHFIGNLGPLVKGEHDRIRAAFQKYQAVEYLGHDLDALSDFFLTKKAPKLNRHLSIIDTNYFQRSDVGISGLVCTVAASDIVELIRSEENPNSVELGIFDQNVRVYLKRTNRINRRIIDSALSDNNHLFWYQNNGITITCDSMDMGPSKRSPKVKLNNVQIVNGGQTSNCLFEAASKDNEDKIEDVLLLVRIIVTTSEDVKLSIAESTNSQTPINVRDLRANDRLQRQLEETFRDKGYFYERKSNQHVGQNKAQRIDALDAAQAYLAYAIGWPEVAKKDRGRIFGDLHDTIFSEDITAEKLLTAHLIMREILKKKAGVRKKIRAKTKVLMKDLSLIDGAYHVLFAVRQLCARDGISMWDKSKAIKRLPEAYKVVGQLYAAADKADENFSSNRYFKRPLTKDEITKKVG